MTRITESLLVEATAADPGSEEWDLGVVLKVEAIAHSAEVYWFGAEERYDESLDTLRAADPERAAEYLVEGMRA